MKVHVTIDLTPAERAALERALYSGPTLLRREDADDWATDAVRRALAGVVAADEIRRSCQVAGLDEVRL